MNRGGIRNQASSGPTNIILVGDGASACERLVLSVLTQVELDGEGLLYPVDLEGDGRTGGCLTCGRSGLGACDGLELVALKISAAASTILVLEFSDVVVGVEGRDVDRGAHVCETVQAGELVGGCHVHVARAVGCEVYLIEVDDPLRVGLEVCHQDEGGTISRLRGAVECGHWKLASRGGPGLLGATCRGVLPAEQTK